MDMNLSAPPPLVASHGLRLAVFFCLMTAMFMSALDHQIVSTALPTIVGEFGQLERFGWVGSAFLLAMSAVMPVYGKLGDLFGRKYVMIAAILIFVSGSALCGLAWSMDTLIAARVVQGLGGGGIMVSIFSINAELFEPRERAKYQSYTSLVLMASGSIGPTLGGTMSELFGWRSIFLLNLPIGAIVLACLVILLPYRRPARRPKIDYAGAILLAGAIASVVLWADSAQIFGSLFAWQSILILLIGTACALLWVKVEARVPEPIVPLKLFRDSTFSLFLVISLTTGGVAIGMVNYLALFLQTTTGLTPTMAGLFFIATTGGIALGSVSAGRLISMTGTYKPFVVTGLALNMVVLAVFSQIGAGTPLFVVGLLMLLQGLAVGIGQQSPVIGVQNSAPRADVGAATGAVTLSRMGGAAIAISIYGAIIGSEVGHVAIELPGVEKLAELTPKMMAELPEATRHAVAQVYSAAFTPLFLTGACLAAIGLAAALALKPVRLPPAAKEVADLSNAARRPILSGMKPEALLHPTPAGLFCPIGRFHVDPVRPVERALITHGHSDHARAGHGTVLATRQTLDIMRLRYGEDFAGSEQAAAFGEEIDVDGVRVSFHPAGHVLGSAQIVIEREGLRIVVSGDYKRGIDPTCEPFVPIACDVFITEATFGLPVFHHPDPKGEIAKLFTSLKQFPERSHLVGAYALGKAQRVIRLIRDCGYHEPIFIHGALAKLCDYYREQGIDLGDIRPATIERSSPAAFRGSIIVGPPSAFQDRWARRFNEPLIAFASGWMMVRQRAKQGGVELPLVISDHCDWPELLSTIREIGPSEVWVTHGREEALVRWCELKGIPARPLHLVGYEDEGD